MVSWEVTRFSVATSTVSQISDILYANGRMQVRVYILISVVEKSTGNPYTLSQSELNSIMLVDYYDTQNKLGGAWSFTDIAGEYTPPLASASALVDMSELGPSNYSQQKQYWVSTTKAENKSIAASIYQPDGTRVTTNNSIFDSHVTLTGKPPIVYTTANITVDQRHIADGTYDMEIVDLCRLSLSWEQDNYYVATSVHPLFKAEVHGYDRGEHGDYYLSHSYSHQVRDCDLNLFFIWDSGPESTSPAGVLKYWKSYIAHAYTNVRIRQRKDTLCLTWLKFHGLLRDGPWGESWRMNCWFVLYDIYGNAGKFKASYSQDASRVIIEDSN